MIPATIQWTWRLDYWNVLFIIVNNQDEVHQYDPALHTVNMETRQQEHLFPWWQHGHSSKFFVFLSHCYDYRDHASAFLWGLDRHQGVIAQGCHSPPHEFAYCLQFLSLIAYINSININGINVSKFMMAQGRISWQCQLDISALVLLGEV